MKTFIWLVFLGIAVYFMVRRAQDYGYPWEDQVEIASYEANKRYRAGSEQLYVHGQVRNNTRKNVGAEIECKTLPGGMTLTPKNTTSVALAPEEILSFEMDLRSRRESTGAECRVRDWHAEGGIEEKVIQGAQKLFNRIRYAF